MIRTKIIDAPDQTEPDVEVLAAPREAVTTYLAEGKPTGTDPAADDETYLADPAWKILKIADEIGGSGERQRAGFVVRPS